MAGGFMHKLSTWTPVNPRITVFLLLWCSCIMSTTLGYDASIMNGLNIMPQYSEYFNLDTTGQAVQSSIVWVGSCVVSVFYSVVADRYGRKAAMWIQAVICLVGVVLQTASQNAAMFIVSRFVNGLGTGAAYICTPVYLVETLPLQWRATGTAILQDFYYVGGLIAAGVTYGTANWASTWSWRLPSLLQGLFAIISLLVLPFIPESPRWLAHEGRHQEALAALAVTHAGGDVDDPVVAQVYKEITDTLAWEREHALDVNYVALLKNKTNWKPLMLAVSVASITMLSGNNIVSYYLGTMLDNAGITDATTQLQINIVLQAWCLVCACLGTLTVDRWGRRPLAIYSSVLVTALLFVVGALTKVYGTSGDQSGVYGTVAAIFLFMAAYSFAWTPLGMLYPAEVLGYSMRSLGMGVYCFLANGFALIPTLAMPYALEAIGWETYMINGAWDVLQLAYIVFCWVETKGLTLEEIEAEFEKREIDGVPVDEKIAELQESKTKC